MAYDPARGLLNGSALVGGLLQQGRETQDYVTGMFDAAARKKAGAAIARGDNQTAAGLLGARGDLEGAATLRKRAATQSSLQAIDAGNFDRAKEESAAAGDTTMYGAAQGAEQDDRAARIGWLSNAADALLQIKDPTQRQQAYREHIAPTLKAMGMDDETIALVDQQSLTDEGLQTFKASMGAVGSLDVQKLDDGTVIGVDKKSGDVRVLHQGATKGVVVGRNVVDPVTGALIYEGPVELSEGAVLTDPNTRGAAGPAASAADGSTPRNMRNNNPGNIEDGEFAKSLPGYKGSDGRFAIFETPEAGASAQVALLGSYGRRGVDTVEKIINRWAPPSDNNPTDKYVQFVARKIGVKPGQKLDMTDHAVLSDIASAIKIFEGGGASASNGSTGARVLAQGKPKRAFEDASPAELIAAGYPPGTRGQKDSETGEYKNLKQPTEAESKAAGYANRVLGAGERMNKLFEAGVRKPQTVTSQLVENKDGVIRIIARTDKDRQFVQAAKEWLAPILRKDTGAAVTDTELATYMDIYIPKFEDSDTVMRQKAGARVDAVRSLLGETNGVYEARYGKPKIRMLMPGEKPAKTNTVKAPSGKVVKIEVVGD